MSYQCRAASLPEEYIPEIEAKLNSVGLKWADFKVTDNTCGPHPPPLLAQVHVSFSRDIAWHWHSRALVLVHSYKCNGLAPMSHFDGTILVITICCMLVYLQGMHAVSRWKRVTLQSLSCCSGGSKIGALHQCHALDQSRHIQDSTHQCHSPATCRPFST